MTSYRAKQVDRNQPEIVAALKAIGARVQCLSSVGGGVPDLLVAYRAFNWLLEIKDGTVCPSDRRLTPHQVTWHRDWKECGGQVDVVTSIAEAVALVRGGR